MRLLELLLLTVGDHREGFGIVAVLAVIAGAFMLFGSLPLESDRVGPVLRRFALVLLAIGAIYSTLALWTPDEARLRCVMRMECK